MAATPAAEPMIRIEPPVPAAVGHELPQETVGRVLRQAVHAHGGGHQRHVVHDGADQADDGDDHVLAPDGLVEPAGQAGQDMGVLQGGHRQQDADEEDDRAHVDLLEGAHQGQVLLGLIVLLAVDQFAHQPEDAQTEEDAHERGQMGDGLEYRHRDQDAEPHGEHEVLLERGGLDTVAATPPISTGLTTSRPFRNQLVMASGTIMLTIEGRKTPFMIARVVIWPPIQSMVVVTSPMGVQAPPALAAMTMMPAKNSRSSCLSSSFFISEIMTMVVVRLSSTALRKKVTKPTSQSSDDSWWS